MHTLFPILVLLTALQRIAELIRSTNNRGSLSKSGFRGIDSRGSYRMMVATHTLWIVGMLVEHTWFSHPLPNLLEFISLGIFILAQLIRLSVMRALGTQWNTRVMAPLEQRSASNVNSQVTAVHDLEVVAKGPYRFIRHPNYLAVILEFISLPLIGGAIVTALVGSVLNGAVLKKRIRIEEAALFARPGYQDVFGNKPRFIPKVTR